MVRNLEGYMTFKCAGCEKTSLAISAFWPKCTDSIIPLNDGKSIFRRYMQNLSMPPLLST